MYHLLFAGVYTEYFTLIPPEMISICGGYYQYVYGSSPHFQTSLDDDTQVVLTVFTALHVEKYVLSDAFLNDRILT